MRKGEVFGAVLIQAYFNQATHLTSRMELYKLKRHSRANGTNDRGNELVPPMRARQVSVPLPSTTATRARQTRSLILIECTRVLWKGKLRYP